MKKGFWFLKSVILLVLICLALGFVSCDRTDEAGIIKETKKQNDERMAWWRQARFGMFIHWGLYAVPAGEWKGETNHAEWILTTAQIPVKEYEKFTLQFNPVKFDA